MCTGWKRISGMRQNERRIKFIRVGGGAVAASTAVGLPDNQREPTLKGVLGPFL